MTSDDLRDAAKDTVDRAKDASGRGAEVGSSLADKAGEVAGRLKDAAGSTFDSAKQQIPASASDAVDAGKRAYADSSELIGRQIGRQPMEALLLAGAIGYLVGWAANRS